MIGTSSVQPMMTPSQPPYPYMTKQPQNGPIVIKIDGGHKKDNYIYCKFCQQ